ncbi:alpha/beta hydrolase [Piscibacillus sp. B03]|uniref:alpha/beta hydrolase n=1 Tax=Piscibacillus sp. B03 TaxID=3457430 RepID=UPI003FCDCCD2
MKKIILLMLTVSLLVLVACSDDNEGAPIEDKVVGTWNGAIEVEEDPLNIVIELDNEEEFTGNISIPIQGLNEFPLTNLKFDGEEIHFEMGLPGQEVAFDGELKNEEQIEGTYTQDGEEYPFYLERGQLAGQTGDRAQPDHMLSVETDHGELKGELLLPEEEGPYPIALIIPGSGPTDRDGNTTTLPGKNNSLKMVAESLAENGIASIRYSKRGAGENQEAIIPENELRFEDFVNDAKAWLHKIHRDERFTKVSVIGHSQGSLVGMLAMQEAGADYFVSLAGAGKSIDEVMIDQLTDQLNEEQFNEAKSVLDQLKQGETVEDVSTELQSLLAPELQPFLISWMQYDPTEEIREISKPILIVQGTNDLQIAESNANNLANANLDAEKLIIEDMNHVLKDAPEDRMSNFDTYTNPELPLSGGLMDGILDFLSDEK